MNKKGMMVLAVLIFLAAASIFIFSLKLTGKSISEEAKNVTQEKGCAELCLEEVCEINDFACRELHEERCTNSCGENNQSSSISLGDSVAKMINDSNAEQIIEEVSNLTRNLGNMEGDSPE